MATASTSPLRSTPPGSEASRGRAGARRAARRVPASGVPARPGSGRGGRAQAPLAEAASTALEVAATLREASTDYLPRRLPPWRLVVGGVALGVIVDAAVASASLRWGLWFVAVLAFGGAALLALYAAEQPRAGDPRRWHLQALASAALMLALMARGSAEPSMAAAWLALLLAAVLLGARSAIRPGGPPWSERALRTAVDAFIVAMAAALAEAVLLAGDDPWVAGAGLVPAAFAGAGYATLVSARALVRADSRGAEAWLLAGVAALCAYVGGAAALALHLGPLGLLGSPSVALAGAVCLGMAAWVAARAPHVEAAAPEPRDDSRLRFVPAAAAGGVIVLLSALELQGEGTRTSFFGVIVLFGLIAARLVATLTENRRLLRRVERSGMFEEKLRDLGAALLAALDRTEALELVCRTAQVSLSADVVHLWMVDESTAEIEAAEVVGPRRQSVLMRRLRLDDPTSLAARVARSGQAEVLTHASSANLSNPFLTVLTHAQCCLAVPIARGRHVQGVLVCIDTRNPEAYGAPEQAKAELLASQVAVALDNAYQHDLQRRRLEEVTALYQFAQAVHTTSNATGIARLLLPILKDRLRYTYAAIWLRDAAGGPARLASGDSPGGVPLAGVRPSELASRALSSGQPVHAGLGWAVDGDYTPPRGGVRSQLAVPLALQQRRVVGVIDLESKQPNAYSLNDERLLVSLAHHAALAIDNLHLAEERRKVDALRELDRLKSDLLSTVSHELRTPLGSIKGYATTLLTHEHKLRREEKREFLEIIDSEADRLRELIENLLDLSRLEAGVLRMEPAWVRLGSVAREVARKVQLASPRHTVDLEWAEDREVLADSRRMYQVIQNLLTNAVKYAPNGGRITLSSHFGQRELTVAVRDEGVGLPERELKRIFDRFHRVDGETSRRIGGTGLGLAICRAFVDAHGGRIWAESAGEGQGSTFCFTLPLVAGAPDEPRPEPRPAIRPVLVKGAA